MAALAQTQVTTPQNQGCLDHLSTYWEYAQKHVEHFVIEQPLIAVVMTIAFVIFGLTQIVPALLSTILIGVPLTAFTFIVGQTIFQNFDEFTGSVKSKLAAKTLERGLQQAEFSSQAQSPETESAYHE